uniref:Uncharacterized protein n=1 Tax=Echinococcus canadensis TaxID=519352 RepID=A0A915EZK2_9CEST
MQNNKLDNALRQLCNTVQFGPFHKKLNRKKVGLVFPKSLVPVAFAQNSSNFEGIFFTISKEMINLPVSFK